MPSLATLATTQLVKGLYLGAPGSGKTGSLTSLVKAGYKLRIYDFDNLLGSLIQFARRECPDKLENVIAQTFTDRLKGVPVPAMMIGGYAKVLPFIDGQPTAFIDGLKQLSYWKTESEDLGNPSEWGRDTFVIIDSLTSLSESAFRYAQALNPAGKDPALRGEGQPVELLETAFGSGLTSMSGVSASSFTNCPIASYAAPGRKKIPSLEIGSA